MDSNQNELCTIISKWQTAYYLSQAILEDYAKHISKIEGKTPEEIKKRITEFAQDNLNKSKIKK